jgi:hypothetical protein
VHPSRISRSGSCGCLDLAKRVPADFAKRRVRGRDFIPEIQRRRRRLPSRVTRNVIATRSWNDARNNAEAMKTLSGTGEWRQGAPSMRDELFIRSDIARSSEKCTTYDFSGRQDNNSPPHSHRPLIRLFGSEIFRRFLSGSRSAGTRFSEHREEPT